MSKQRLEVDIGGKSTNWVTLLTGPERITRIREILNDNYLNLGEKEVESITIKWVNGPTYSYRVIDYIPTCIRCGQELKEKTSCSAS